MVKTEVKQTRVLGYCPNRIVETRSRSGTEPDLISWVFCFYSGCM
jgi:hypothetical protein